MEIQQIVTFLPDYNNQILSAKNNERKNVKFETFYFSGHNSNLEELSSRSDWDLSKELKVAKINISHLIICLAERHHQAGLKCQFQNYKLENSETLDS